ncbi:MAG: YqeG family HAD IIIA-type phosphatase [Oscillospiraceae bacterium]|jgi:HAD superfamily phosphatase (TIGR01668 family)|nr:YqeG family HAD IIIA-type phosphatase [Oscillospiraceae bacterium]
MNFFKPSFYYEKVVDIGVPFLKTNNVECILLDIDGTIAPHDLPMLVSGFKPWFKGILKNGIKMVLVSNNHKNRVKFIAEKLNLPFVYFSFKPLPLGIIRALKIVSVDKSKSIMVGDQIFTDILGANVCGIRSVLVDPTNIKKGIMSKIKNWAEKPIRRNLGCGSN